MKNKIDIKYGRLFPWPFQLLAVIALIIASFALIERPVPAIGFIIASGFVLTGSEGTEINVALKTYREYKSFFLIKTGSKLSYAGIEKLFVNTSRSKQQLYTAHTNKSSVFENIEYNAFVKFTDGTKIKLMQKRKKADLINTLKKVSAFLKVPIEDNIA